MTWCDGSPWRRVSSCAWATLVIAMTLGACSSGKDTASATPEAVASAVGQPATDATGDGAEVDATSTLPRLIVGEDIEPGINVAHDLGTCYYARLARETDTAAEAIGQSNALGSQVFVEIAPTDAAFLSSACGEWRAATPDDMSPTPDGGIPSDGMWLVPENIAPGTYETVATDLPVGCFTQTVSDLSASLESIGDTQQGMEGRATLTIGPDVRAVRIYRCGAWTKVG